MSFRVFISVKDHLLRDLLKDGLKRIQGIEIAEREEDLRERGVDLVIADRDSLDISRDFHDPVPTILVDVSESTIYFCPVIFGMRIWEVLEGGDGIRKALWRSSRFLRMIRMGDRGDGYGLTRREKDVLDLLYLGYCDKEIARKLGIGTTSVKAHLRRIYRKLGVSGRMETIFKAVLLDL